MEALHVQEQGGINNQNVSNNHIENDFDRELASIQNQDARRQSSHTVKSKEQLVNGNEQGPTENDGHDTVDNYQHVSQEPVQDFHENVNSKENHENGHLYDTDQTGETSTPNITPGAEVKTGGTLSRETTDVSLDLDLTGPSHDQKEAQSLIVKCQLCTENMRMPKILPCLHSFCEQCLESYVKKLIDRSRTTTITCPLCHHVALVSRNRVNSREYIESLPPSTLISTVMSKKAARTRLCSVCKSDTNKATTWCGSCALAFCEEHVQYHKQLTSTKHRHPTVNLDDIGTNKSTIMFPYQKCNFHRKEDLHLFCKEEWTPCCHVCRKMLHRTCDVQKASVVPMSVAANKIKDSKHAKTLRKRLDALREEAEEISEDRIKNLDELELQLRLGRESISTIRATINEHLDQLEDELHDELTEIYERTRVDLEDERDKAEIKLRTVVYYQNYLENIMIHSPEMQAISEMSRLRDQSKTMEGDLYAFKRKAKNFEISITTYAEYFKQIAKMGSLQRREISAYKATTVPAPAPPGRTKTNLHKGTSNSKSTLT